MKLEYLKLNNFRQYYGEQTIRFACDSPRHVTVIRGINGAGKTSLFTALNWCLYGESTDNMGELASKRAVTEDTGTVETRVELGFRHEGAKYVAKRRREGYLFEEIITSESDDTFALFQIGTNGQYEAIRDPIWKIGSILPSDVRKYFFFDGEKIDDFARPGHEDEVRNAVRKVLKIEAIDRAKEHLQKVASSYRSELKKHTEEGKLQNLLSGREKIQTQRDELAGTLNEHQREIAAAKNHEEDIDQELKKIESSRHLAEERTQIKNEVTELQRREKQLWLEIRDFANRGFVPLAKTALESAKGILEGKRRRGEIPPGIRETLLNDLLADMQCICGRSIQDGSEEHQNILERLKESISSSLEITVLDTASDLNHLLRQVKDIRENVKSLMGNRGVLDGEIESREGRLKEIGKQLKDSDIAEVRQLENNLERQRNMIKALEAEIHHARGRIEEKDKQIAECDEEIKKAQASKQRARYYQKCVTLATESARTASEIYERFADDMRKTIETEAQSIFEQLILKERHFKSINLSADYRLDVVDRYAMEARPEMSAGERQVLSLAFIAGLAKVAREGETMPLVMDTPFGRLSSAHREMITENLPEIADQLILFVTDEELRDQDQARDNLAPKIGAEYHLNFNQENSSTTIEPVEG